MVVLRCTRELATRLTLAPGAEDLQPTAKLGDWYAGLLNVGHERFVHCVSERSLLSIVLPARGVRQLPSRVPGAVASLLARLGVPGAVVEAEVSAMLPVCVGLTRSRSVVGSLVELGREAAFSLAPGGPPTADIEFALAAVPCLKRARRDALPHRRRPPRSSCLEPGVARPPLIQRAAGAGGRSRPPGGATPPRAA